MSAAWLSVSKQSIHMQSANNYHFVHFAIRRRCNTIYRESRRGSGRFAAAHVLAICRNMSESTVFKALYQLRFTIPRFITAIKTTHSYWFAISVLAVILYFRASVDSPGSAPFALKGSLTTLLISFL